MESYYWKSYNKKEEICILVPKELSDIELPKFSKPELIFLQKCIDYHLSERYLYLPFRRQGSLRVLESLDLWMIRIPSDVNFFIFPIMMKKEIDFRDLSELQIQRIQILIDEKLEKGLF